MHIANTLIFTLKFLEFLSGVYGRILTRGPAATRGAQGGPRGAMGLVQSKAGLPLVAARALAAMPSMNVPSDQAVQG